MAYFGMGSHATNDSVLQTKERAVILACDTYQEAESWVNILEQQIRCLDPASVNSSNFPSRRSSGLVMPSEVRLDAVEEWIKNSKWKVFSISDGVRIFENITNMDKDVASRIDPSSSAMISTAMWQQRCPPCLRLNMAIPGSPSDVRDTI
jgi:hypothetical protein